MKITAAFPGLLLALTTYGGPLNCGGGGGGNDHIPPTMISPETEAEALLALEIAFVYRDTDYYASLLADDFRFYPDSTTRAEKQLPEFWGRSQDSVCTWELFESPDMIETRIKLTYNGRARIDMARPGTTFIDVADAFVEVEFGPSPTYEDGVTFLVDGQTPRFYFRRGKSQYDTLATSTTANRMYLLEWRNGGTPLQRKPQAIPTVRATLSGIKTLYCL